VAGSGEKQFRIPAGRIKPVATGRGSCIATDRITVEGCQVGYMYREEADRAGDSGWCFTAGDESEAYMNKAENFALYDVNTIANYDPGIIPFLDARPGSAFARNEVTGRFERVPFEAPQ
jgi:hypothetical protein